MVLLVDIFVFVVHTEPPFCALVLQLGFNIRGGKASQLGIFISKVRALVGHMGGHFPLWLPGCRILMSPGLGEG